VGCDDGMMYGHKIYPKWALKGYEGMKKHKVSSPAERGSSEDSLKYPEFYG
jgi:hypothetical protein